MSRMRVPCQDPPPHPRSKTHLMVRKAYPAFRALPEVAPAQAPCPQLGLLGWRDLPSSTYSQFLSVCMAPPSAPTLGRVLSPPQSPTPDSTALHGPCWVLEGPRDGPLSPQPGTASLFCSTDEFLSPSQGPTRAPLLPQALPDWDSRQCHSHPALGQHCPWTPLCNSSTLAGPGTDELPSENQGMAEW